MDYKYVYNVFDNQGNERRFVQTVGAASPSEAIKKAGLDWLTAIKTRRGLGYTNAAIYLYDIWYEGREKTKADFIMERIF